MRVLHFIPSLGLSGAEKQLSHLCAALSARGVDCHVAFLEDASEDAFNRERLLGAGVSLHRMTGRNAYDPRFMWSVRSLARRLRPDLMQTWNAMMDVVGGLALRGVATPWVVSERNYPALVERTRKMRIRDHIVPWCDAIVANSQSGCEYWRERLPPSIPCRVISNALDVDSIRAAEPGDPAELGLRSDAPLVVYVGRLWPHKNIDGILQAFERILRQTDACAAIIGRGSEHGRAEAFVREQGLEGRLAVPGFIPNPWPWLRRANVFLSMSHTEGMPNVVMEAVVCGCPVVLSDIAPHRDLLDEASAEFVPTHDPEEAARAVVALLRDPQLARLRAEHAAREVHRWSIDEAAEAYLRFYRELLQTAREAAAANSRSESTPGTGSSGR